MANVKLENKSKNFSGMFSNDEKFDENESLVLGENTNLTVSETDEFFDNKKHSLVNFLKQFFLFLPGTLLLYFISFSTTIIFWDILVRRNYSFSISSLDLIILLLLFIFLLIGSLMTWIGLGKLKNKKHFVIPISIIILGAVFGVVLGNSKLGPNQISGILYSFRQAILLFPLVLIVPILLKKWIDKKDNRNSAES